MKGKNLRRIPSFFLMNIFLALLFTFSNLIEVGAEDPVNIKISALPYLSYAPIFIAYEEGYFAEQGLNLEFVKFRQSGLSMPALARGDIDVSTDSIGSSLFSAVSRGLKIKVVADKGYLSDRCSSSAIMVRKDLYDSGELKTVNQLKGRKVALGLVPVWGYVYETILSSGNLTLDDIEIVKMPTAARIMALETGAIDAAGFTEPMLTKAETLGIAVKLADYQDFVPNYQVSTIIYGPNLLEKKPELGRKFMVAYLKGVRQFNKGKTERNIEILQKHTRLDADILKKLCFVSFHRDGQINMDTIRVVQDWAYKRGYIDKKVPVNQLVDMSFAEYADKILE